MKTTTIKRSMLLLIVLVLSLVLVSTAIAEEPGPNDLPAEPALADEPPLPEYGTGEESDPVELAPGPALTALGEGVIDDFESGSLAGWGLYRAGSTYGWQAYTGTYSPMTHHPIDPPPQGNFAAASDQLGPNVQIMYRYLSLPATPMELSFTLYYKNWSGAFFTPDSLSYTNQPNQQYRVDLLRLGTNPLSVVASDILENLFRTEVGDPLAMAPTTLTFDLSAYSGQTVLLRFAEVDNQSYFNASVDNIQLSNKTGVTPRTISSDLQFPGDVLTIAKTVKTPGISPKPDIYFLADTTGSMVGAIANVRSNAAAILASIASQANAPQFGAGNYKDFPYDPYAFQNNASIDGQATALAAINSWSAGGGWDGPEAQLFALDQIAEGAPGWRTGSTKIVVWFGDWPGHDPVCSGISGLSYDITEASVTAKLVEKGIRVIAISVTSGVGMDLDPQPYSNDYISKCGTPGGSEGQASRIAEATGGVHLHDVSPGEVSAKILEGLTNLPATVTPQLDPACSTDLSFSFSPASVTVASGETASFDETITIKSDAAGGGFANCTIDWLINGVSAGEEFLQSVSLYVNGPPTADAGGPYTGDEGSAIALDGTASFDPDDDPMTFAWSVDSTLCSFDDETSATPYLTCTDNGNFTVTLEVNDGYASDTASADVTVNNVAPTATFNAPMYVIAGDNFELSLTSPYDPSSVDMAAGFEYAFDCGDGAGYVSTGGLEGWDLNIPDGGFAITSNSHTSDLGNLFTPMIGNEFLLLKTDGPGSYTTASRTFVGKAGETISGWAFFDAQDYAPYNDHAQVTISLDGTLMATLFSASVSDVGNYGDTPWTFWEYTFPSDGAYVLKANVTNELDSILDSLLGVDVQINTATCSTSADQVGDRTVKGKIMDKDGGYTEYTATVTVLPPSAATDSSLCYYDREPDVDGQQFRLVFTPDMQQYPASKLPASNPGQFFYNVFYTGDGPASFDITIPEDFETQGANPVHVYTGVSVIEENGFKCFVPEGEIYAGDFSGLTDLPVTGGFLYVNVHLDFKHKGTTGYIPNFNNDALDAGDETTVLIPNFNTYTFSVTGSQNDSRDIQNSNDFKKIPGFGGLVTNDGSPVEGATIQIMLDGQVLGQAVTDEDGWYMFEYKHTGKPVEFTVTLLNADLSLTEKSAGGTLKANKFVEVNFTLD